jgi:uncharacterized protein YlxW (UPF0749 family)
MTEEAMQMRDLMQQMRGRAKYRWGVARMKSLDQQNMRLRDEVSHLRTRLEDDRSEMEDLKDALKSSPKVVTVKKRAGLFRLAVVGGTAYLLGTRAGRERYDRFVDWVRSLRSKMDRSDEAVVDVEPRTSRMTTGSTSATGMPVPGP